MAIKKPNDVEVIAEIGCNHGGSLEKAQEYIEAAAACGAHYAKFQKRDIAGIPEQVGSRPRGDVHSFGPTEREHRQALEFSIEQHAKLKEHCEALGIKYACSAWDEISYNQLEELGAEYIKIPSACNERWEGWNRRGRTVPLHISLGMLTAEKRDRLIRDHGERWKLPRVTFYACTSKYPCRADETYLLDIPYLVERAGVAGFSGHHNGIALDLGAYLLGATYIERHFTLDRTEKGTDHAASLEPKGLSKLVRDLQAVKASLKPKPGNLPSCEESAWKKFKGDK